MARETVEPTTVDEGTVERDGSRAPDPETRAERLLEVEAAIRDEYDIDAEVEVSVQPPRSGKHLGGDRRRCPVVDARLGEYDTCVVITVRLDAGETREYALPLDADDDRLDRLCRGEGIPVERFGDLAEVTLHRASDGTWLLYIPPRADDRLSRLGAWKTAGVYRVAATTPLLSVEDRPSGRRGVQPAVGSVGLLLFGCICLYPAILAASLFIGASVPVQALRMPVFVGLLASPILAVGSLTGANETTDHVAPEA